ncbi:hypothetical protein NUU61_001232 [Penicillium alfredii]|uniref:Uncharacterized protein n=1 Tax=Penicillium alfredii TaxID=1506179 RepID=A0A9W9GBM2_9EURO|nr:uncharacterized protein NUU61_001232 [Penicillium alfredii]KAJ5115473.1 hypothetical protein NUU61_001232 [Penicillium alfredii]
MVSIRVPTWSSNPLDTAWASVTLGLRNRAPGRCMMSVHDTELPSKPRPPQNQQQSAWKSHKQVRIIVYYTWALTCLSFVWFIVAQVILVATRGTMDKPCNGCNAYLGTNWNLLRDVGGTPMSAAILPEYQPAFFAGLFALFYVFQGLMTLALHCADLIAAVYLDEQIWRECYTAGADYNPRPNALLQGITSRATGTLFVLKIVLHWLFGNAVSYAYNWGLFFSTTASSLPQPWGHGSGGLCHIPELAETSGSTARDIRPSSDLSGFGGRVAFVIILG